jgi:glutathione S-transferase
MKLYSGPLSLFSRKVEIALGEKGLDYERIGVPFTQTRGYSPKHPDVLAVNPKGQVPVLVDGGLSLYDSTIILEYLEDAYPEPPLFPDDPAERAQCRLYELLADEILIVPLRHLMYRTEPPSEDAERRAAQAAKAAEAEATIAAELAALDQRLGDRDFFCEDFSVADIAVFMSVMFGLRLGGPPIRDLSALSAWYDRLLARPPFAAVVAEVEAADRALSQPIVRQ